MNNKEKAKRLFFWEDNRAIIEENDKDWLTQLANEGDIHAAYILVVGMHTKYRTWEETFTDEDTGETVTLTRNEYIEGSTFPRDEAEEARLVQMLFDAKDQMSDDELKIASFLPVDALPLLLERIRRGDDEAAVTIDDPKILQELCEKGNKVAAEQMGYKYDAGDEENGIFVNPQKAKEYFDIAGEDYEFQMPSQDPHEADYFLHGSAQELAQVKALVDQLTKRYGTLDNEFGLFVPMEVLMEQLVGSKYYEGNLLRMNSDDPECIVLHAEANSMSPLLYALRQRFPSLNIEMQETAI